MSEALTAQFLAGRQVAQPTGFQVSQGQGMSGAQVADYLRGNALNIGQRLDGQNAIARNIDPASDIRARESFTQDMTKSVYDADQAMQRQKMDLEGRKAIAESNNKLTRELGLARIASEEGMLDKNIQSREKITFAQLNQSEKELFEKARQFDTQTEFNEWAEKNKLSENEKNRIFQATQNDKKLIEEARKFDTLQAWEQSKFAQNLEESERKRVFEASQNQKDRDLAGKKIESAERIAFGQIENQLKIAGMQDTTRNRIADMADAIDKEKIAIMQDEVAIKDKQLEFNKELSLLELDENKRQFDERLEQGYAQIDADMAKASAADKRMLEVARMQLDGSKYNVDKSYELKMLERQDESNRAANIQPIVDDMLAKVMAWKSGGMQQEQEKLEAAFIMSNAAKIQGIDITTLYKPNGNPNQVAINKAKEAFYSNPENKDLRDSMNQFVSSGIQATTTQMNELERIAFTYKGKYAPSTTPPGNAITAPQQGGSGRFAPQLPPGYAGPTP